MLKRESNKSYSQAEINVFEQFLRDKTLPNSINTPQKIWYFNQTASKFNLQNDKLYIGNCPVIASENITELLEKQYNNVKTRINGRDRAFKTISTQYYGITKRKIGDFLNSQELHQLHLNSNRAKDIIPIIPKEPYARWQMDLIVIGKKTDGVEGVTLSAFAGNAGNKYILTIIDCFTKFVHAVALKDRESNIIANSLISILESEIAVDIHHIPKIIQSDNEFDTAEIRQVCAQYGIKQIFSKSHVSSSGTIERLNQTVKNMIWQEFTQSTNKKWIEKLDDIVNNYNNTYHTVTKKIPAQIHPIKGKSHDISVVRKNIIAKVGAKINYDVSKFPQINKGDKVRLLIAAIDATVRAKIKTGSAKGYTTKWTSDIYTVISVSRPKSEFIRPKYTVKLNENNISGVFSRDQIQLIDISKLKLIAKPIINVNTPNIQKTVLKPISQITPRRSTRLSTIQKPDEPEYAVEAILSEKNNGRQKLFEVKWVGFDQTTFEPLKNIKNTIVYDEYLKKHNK